MWLKKKLPVKVGGGIGGVPGWVMGGSGERKGRKE